MKTPRILALAAIVSLAACDRAPTEIAPAPEAAPAAVAVSPAAPFYSPLPDDGIRFDFPFHVASDRYYEVDSGAVRRRLVIEYLDGSAETVWREVTAGLDAAGYEATTDGGTVGMRRSFAKPGVPGIFVEVRPGKVESPANPDARGVIWMSWQVKSAPKKADVAPASTP